MYLNKGDIITCAGGHNGHFGAVYNGKKEENLTKELSNEVVRILNIIGFKAYEVSPLGRYTEQSQLTAEISNANKYNSKIHICLHFNACASHKGVGTETWIYGLGGNAEIFGKQVCKEIANLGFDNRGVKTSKGLRVPKETKAPCILQEICFMDNLSDLNKYDYRPVAKAIVKGITGIDFSENNTSADNVKYRVISDAFKSKEYALNKQDRLKNSGYDSFLDFKNSKYYVVVGSFDSKENANKRINSLSKDGFNSFIEIVNK